MKASGKRRFVPALKQLVVEASQALARLDADRLEELAKSCEALTRVVKQGDDQEFAAALITSAREAAGEMDIFARVLEATRANAQVMRRLMELREGRLEYGGDERLGQGHGNN
jgi:hypothetical protein